MYPVRVPPADEKIRIALIQPEAAEVARIKDLVKAGSLSVDLADVIASERPDLGGAQIILVGVGRLEAPERETLERVHAGYPHIPMIVLADGDGADWTGEALSLGAQHVLDKSRQTPEKLSSTIRYYVRYGRRAGPLGPKEVGTPPAA